MKGRQGEQTARLTPVDCSDLSSPRISDLVKSSDSALEQRDRVQEMLNEKAVTIESIYKEKESLAHE